MSTSLLRLTSPKCATSLSLKELPESGRCNAPNAARSFPPPHHRNCLKSCPLQNSQHRPRFKRRQSPGPSSNLPRSGLIQTRPPPRLPRPFGRAGPFFMCSSAAAYSRPAFCPKTLLEGARPRPGRLEDEPAKKPSTTTTQQASNNTPQLSALAIRLRPRPLSEVPKDPAERPESQPRRRSSTLGNRSFSRTLEANQVGHALD